MCPGDESVGKSACRASVRDGSLDLQHPYKTNR